MDVRMNQIILPFPRQSKLEVCVNNCNAMQKKKNTSQRSYRGGLGDSTNIVIILTCSGHLLYPGEERAFILHFSVTVHWEENWGRRSGQEYEDKSLKQKR